MKTNLMPEDRRRIAEKVNVSDAYLYQCLTGRRDMNPVEAVRVERDSGGEITRFDVCTKTGAGIWPELAHVPASVQEFASETVAGV